MKKNFFIIISLLSALSTYAQYDFAQFVTNKADTRLDPDQETESGIYFSGGKAPANTNILVAGDTMFFPYTVGDLTPASGEIYSKDTLTLDISINNWSSTVSPTFTLSNRNNSYTFTNAATRQPSNATFDLIEDQIDTIKLVMISGTLELDHVTIHPSGATVILSRDPDLPINKASISNPVEDGQLIIDLDGDVADFELLNMQGQVLKNLPVSGKQEFPVSDLNTGIYYLRDRNTVSYRRIMIK